MTAAHCVDDIYRWDYVIVGDHSRINASDGTKYEVCRFMEHPKYHKLRPKMIPKYDFSILHLKKPVEIGPRAVPACLPTLKHGGDFLAGKILTASGWGITLNTSDDSDYYGGTDRLRFVKVPGITNVECEKLYINDTDNHTKNSYGDSPPIYAAELCAGDTDIGGIDTCMGDSGGNI